MPFSNLSSFVSHLEKNNHLHRIKVEVDPLLEITEIVSRVAENKGPALLFENVKGSRFPIVVNTLAHEDRIKWALGRHPAEVGDEIGSLLKDAMPPNFSTLWKHRRSFSKILAMKPCQVNSPSFKKNRIEPSDLEQLPIAQTWPLDGGRFMTYPLVITKSPVDGKQNMGVYRMHTYNKNQTGMHWQIGKGGGFHYKQAEELNQNLPVSVVLGADPILMLCGVLPLPEGLDEIVFAGFLRGQSTSVASLNRNNMRVPAEAEFILEGTVPPHERRMEGPYGDHFGHYSLAAPFPIFNVEKIWHRDNAIFPISVVGKPPQEDQVVGDAVQQMLLPLLKFIHPEISDMWAYMEAGFHNLLVISVKQRFEKEGVKSALWAFGEGQLSLSKCIIVVDSHVNPRDIHAVLKAVRENFIPSQDFILLPGTSQDTLDFTSFKMNLGSKMILDATQNSQQANQKIPVLNHQKIRSMDPRIISSFLLDDTFLIIKVDTKSSPLTGREILKKMINLTEINDVKMVAAVSDDIPLDNQTLLLWGIFTRFDCQRDSFFQKVELKGGHPLYSGPLMIDATWKPGYPDPVSMTPNIIKKVDQRWKDYGF
ncbi:MAG: UbiD family decarboxylase [Elusimicrobiota bacterium]